MRAGLGMPLRRSADAIIGGLESASASAAGNAAPEGLLVVARGCVGVGEAESAAVRAEGGAALRWQIENTHTWVACA